MSEKSKIEEKKVVHPVEKDSEKSKAPEKDLNGTIPGVELSKTEIGSEWAKQLADNQKDAQENESSILTSYEDELESLRTSGSVLHDPEAKKAALLGEPVSEKDQKKKEKSEEVRTNRIAELEDQARYAALEGNVIYDAEAKKAALLGGNPDASKAELKASK